MKVFPKCHVTLTDKFYADRAVVHAVASVRDSRYETPRTYCQPFRGLLVWILLDIYKVNPLKRKNLVFWRSQLGQRPRDTMLHLCSEISQQNLV